jgi:glycosyltransferase involved in cell wall biosynthesis
MLPPRETQDQTIARASLPDLYLGDQWNDPDVVTGLSLGFIAQPKKHLLMLEVLGFVKQRELVAPKKIKFIIAGMPSPPSSGGEHLLNNLRTMVTRHGLKDDVLILPEFVPFRLLPVLYGAADFTVHICGESNHSSSGSVRQDLSYGMPVLVQHAELTADLPSDTVMFFRNQKDIESMLPLIIKQEDRRRQLSEKARAMARAHSWPGIASKHVRLYEQVSGRPLIEGRWPGVRRAIMHAMGWAGRGRAIA